MVTTDLSDPFAGIAEQDEAAAEAVKAVRSPSLWLVGADAKDDANRIIRSWEIVTGRGAEAAIENYLSTFPEAANVELVAFPLRAQAAPHRFTVKTETVTTTSIEPA